MKTKINNQLKVSDEEVKLVCFAIKTLQKRYPNNKKIYLSLISTFFFSKSNEKIILDNFKNYVPFEKGRIYDVCDYLESLKIISIFVGGKGAKYLSFNDEEYNHYLSSFKKLNITIDDLKAVLFAIVCLRKQYPNSQGKVYLSLIAVFFYSSNNQEKILNVLKKKPNYTREEIFDIVLRLVALNLVRVVDGDRGAKYIYLNEQNYLEFIEKNTENYDKMDLKAIIFSVDCLEKQYPKNHGNVYLSNIYDFFLDKRNNQKLIKEFGKTYHYTRNIILEMLDILVQAGILAKFIGSRGAVIVRNIINNRYNKENAVLSILEKLNGKCMLSTLSSIVFKKEKDISPFYVDSFFNNLDLFKSQEDLDQAIAFLLEREFVGVNNNLIFLTYEGNFIGL